MYRSMGGKEKNSLGTGSTNAHHSGHGNQGHGAGGGQMGKDANVPLVTLLFRVWILGVLKAYSSPA